MDENGLLVMCARCKAEINIHLHFEPGKIVISEGQWIVWNIQCPKCRNIMILKIELAKLTF